jgi:hypothetical protein
VPIEVTRKPDEMTGVADVGRADRPLRYAKPRLRRATTVTSRYWSRASSSSTTVGSSLVKIGDGLATGVPAAIGCRSQLGEV